MLSSHVQRVVLLMAQWEPSAADLPVYSPMLWWCFHLDNCWRPEENSGESQRKGDMSLSRTFYLTVQIPRSIFNQDCRSTLRLIKKSLAFPCSWCGNRLCHQPEAKQGLCNTAACCKSLLSLSCLILLPLPAPGAINNSRAAMQTLKTDWDTQESLLITGLLDYYKRSEFGPVC